MRKEIWTETASNEYDQNIDYLLRNWSEKVALDFIEKVESVLYNIKASLVEYLLTNRGNVRKCVICKQITLFYQINNTDDVEILSFWSNYKDDKEIKF
jgi:plasmid stabilization system protein ParE